jgi:hypothetical protein
MPMPRLLKKLSRKSLRKRSQSITSPVEVHSEDPPPLPTPKSAASDASYGYVISRAPPLPTSNLNGSSPYLPHVDKPFPPEPVAPNGGPYPPPPLVIANGNAVPEDDFSKDLRGAWTSATTAPKVSKVDKVLLQLGMFRS